MAKASSRALLTGEQVVDLLDCEDSDDNGPFDDGLEEVFFPGSDDELGFLEEDELDNR